MHMWEQGCIQEISVPQVQFGCEPKTALEKKKKVYFKKRTSPDILLIMKKRMDAHELEDLQSLSVVLIFQHATTQF